MSTKSIFKDVVMDNSASCSKFVSALERSLVEKSNQVVISKKVTTVRGETLNRMFQKQ